MLTATCVAWAHDDDEKPTPVDPSIFSGAGTLLMIIAAAVIVGAVWYHLRRRALLQEGRKPSPTGEPR
jgi:hypothetical protein